MASVIKFITICQKILILLSILCFIPTSIFVFSPKNTLFTNQQVNGYTNALKQIQSSFIVSLQANSNCSWRQALLNNEYCYKRGRPNQFNVQVVGGISKCNGYSYRFQSFQYCSGYYQQENGTILNKASNNQLVHSDLNYPIFNIYPPFQSPIIVDYLYLALPSHESCKALAQSLTKNIQQKYSSAYYQNYQDSERLLWYYSIPILGIVLILILVNQFSDSLNLRRYILISTFWLDIALIVLIAKGIYYFTTVENFSLKLIQLSSCFAGSSRDNIYSLSNFPRLTFGFIFFIGIVMLVVFLSMVGLVIMKIVEWKYNKSREISSTGVELTELKTSLRSRVKNIDESHSSKRFVLVDSEL